MNKDNFPLVTIGIPVYNVASYVEKCIISVLSQTYPQLEVLIIDDCGLDNSIQVIETIKVNHPKGNCIKIIRQPYNLGPGEARNRSIREALGKYIYFVDSDDYIEPDTISCMVEQAESNKSDIVIATMRVLEFETGKTRPAFTYPSLQVIRGKDAFAHKVCANLRWNIGVSACNILFNLSFLRENNLFFAARKDEDALFLSDYYSEIGCAVLMPDITYNYVHRQGSIMGKQARAHIPVEEIRERFRTDALMTQRCVRLKDRSFYDAHCSRVLKHKFRAVCVALRHRDKFTERLSNMEIREEIKHPATLRDILKFKRYKLYNLAFYMVSQLPPRLSVLILSVCGRLIRWI